MSEKLQHKAEHNGETPRELKERIEALQHKAESEANKSKHEHRDNLEHIRSKVESTAQSKHEHKAAHHQEKAEDERPAFVNKELKSIAYRRTLKRTQNKLPAPERAFSKLIHNPAIETISEVASKTVARPSGILLGGIFASIGSLIFVWVSKHYGYEYNYLLLILFFVGGFFVGLAVELGLKLAQRK